MIFAPYDTKRHVNYPFPSFTITDETLQNVNIFKYLSHLISNDLYDDIVRQMGLLYGYVKCAKMFFGFERLHSVTAMFMQQQLPTFNTLLHNSKLKFSNTCKQHSNNLVSLVHLIT